MQLSENSLSSVTSGLILSQAALMLRIEIKTLTYGWYSPRLSSIAGLAFFFGIFVLPLK